ncbi:rIIB protector from prophage-induced early lysis [Escherichia phage Phi1]|uniref:RIIB protector from prophage-induced early lysis n=1 Tax=Escherichia phage Phi1 TaxID=448384 RepID=A7XFP9_9CAUD|nr:RIIB lysis inhibitor [Escherichia phage Phi1]ABR24783.1 rIIB protector from prophage-induced early lysis [Escherichia phage Phi1]
MTKAKITVSDRNVQCLDSAKQIKLAKQWGEGKFTTREALAAAFGVSRRTASRVLLIQKDAVAEGRKALEKRKARRKTSKGKGGERAKKPVTTTSKIVAIASTKFITITCGDIVYTADPSHVNFKEALEAVKQNDFIKAITLIDIKKAVEVYYHGAFRIENGIVYYHNIVLDNNLTRRVVESIKENKPYTHYLNFFEKCKKNPSRKAVDRLFDFLEHNDIEIGEDGCFYAWKRVDVDYKDFFTHTFDNSPGRTVKMKRKDVDPDDDRTCSNGLHVAAKHYIPHYGGGRGRIIKCKVDPRHVVSIPKDYANAKMRCHRYYVVEDVTEGFSHY